MTALVPPVRVIRLSYIADSSAAPQAAVLQITAILKDRVKSVLFDGRSRPPVDPDQRRRSVGAIGSICLLVLVERPPRGARRCTIRVLFLVGFGTILTAIWLAALILG
jgi:hypothetical protein